eukprot:scaffold18121_cov117-Isochrysis_galbana.AAC.5
MVAHAGAHTYYMQVTHHDTREPEAPPCGRRAGAVPLDAPATTGLKHHGEKGLKGAHPWCSGAHFELLDGELPRAGIHLEDRALLLAGGCVELGWQGHAIEVGPGGRGVGAHVAEVKPLTDLDVGQRDVLRDAVEAIAGGAPDRRRVARARVSISVGEGAAEGLRGWRHLDFTDDVVVVEVAVKRAVDTVVDVVHGA